MSTVDTPHLKSEPLDRVVAPFQRFANMQTSGGIVLLLCAVVAIIWANSPWGETYEALWSTEIVVGFGEYSLTRSLHFWINDGLMAVFFFVIGLEIKREVLVGELSSPRQAALPVIAAFGGMVFMIQGQAADPQMLIGIELDTIAAVVLGGASIFGGRGSVLGTVLGVLLVQVINNSLVLVGVPTAWQRATVGLLLLLGVGAQAWVGRRPRRAAPAAVKAPAVKAAA